MSSNPSQQGSSNPSNMSVTDLPTNLQQKADRARAVIHQGQYVKDNLGIGKGSGTIFLYEDNTWEQSFESK